MAAPPWNKINIPFPGAISSVRVPFTSATDTNIEALLVEMEAVQRLLNSKILQTEVRVLYELIFIHTNSFRGHRTFQCIKQVEQCINRLKNMKLEAALIDLANASPQTVQRKLGLKSGECDVPSQPMLEWICLKVLGAARLMACTLTRCRRSFLLVRQQMRWSEFLVLNVTITAMLSRLWVIFRGLLFCLSKLYKQLLDLLRAVVQTKPMPFLTDFVLPENLIEFLGPSEACFLTSHPTFIIKNLENKEVKPPVEVENNKNTNKEDFGVAIQRDASFDPHLMPYIDVFKNMEQRESLADEIQPDETEKFQKQVRKAASFGHMSTQLEEMIRWCTSQGLKKEEHLLSFLLLKCRRMMYSGAGNPRKLSNFRWHVCWALSPRGPMPKTFHSFAALIRKSRRRTRFQALKGRLRSAWLRTGVRRKPQIKKRKEAELTKPRLSEDHQHNHPAYKVEHLSTNSDRGDDIDDIFASLDL